MNESVDILTILFLVLAVLIFLRLRSVLGKRTGNERPPIDPYSTAEKARHEGDDNVVRLPRGGDGEPAGYQIEETAEDRIRDFMPLGGPVADGLLKIAEEDPTFEPKSFVQGAKAAYEMIVNAFAEGNKGALKDLLSREVYEGFVQEIRAREERNEMADTNFIGINKADVIEADLQQKTARVTVKFVSQLITAIRNRDGEVIDGDPNQVREVTDIWTFARDVSSRNPNWKLVATQAAN